MMIVSKVRTQWLYALAIVVIESIRNDEENDAKYHITKTPYIRASAIFFGSFQSAHINIIPATIMKPSS